MNPTQVDREAILRKFFPHLAAKQTEPTECRTLRRKDDSPYTICYKKKPKLKIVETLPKEPTPERLIELKKQESDDRAAAIAKGNKNRIRRAQQLIEESKIGHKPPYWNAEREFINDGNALELVGTDPDKYKFTDEIINYATSVSKHIEVPREPMSKDKSDIEVRHLFRRITRYGLYKILLTVEGREKTNTEIIDEYFREAEQEEALELEQPKWFSDKANPFVNNYLEELPEQLKSKIMRSKEDAERRDRRKKMQQAVSGVQNTLGELYGKMGI
tara:strand:- start:564 stop:1385 length:822 start_codon:yes stop_codon:yes gene_type:complete